MIAWPQKGNADCDSRHATRTEAAGGHPSFLEGWDSADASIMGFRVRLRNAAQQDGPPASGVRV
jgi:hypothetical protein